MINVKRKAIIFGIKGTMLTKVEKTLLKEEKPWGIIIFSRNIENILQLKKLITDIRNIMRDKKYPILIDQEGGKVSRLNKILDFSLFSQTYFGNLYRKDNNNFYYYYKIYIEKISNIFRNVGININTAPVLDVLSRKTHDSIRDRSYSENVDSVSKIGLICTKLFAEYKIATVIKHIPGLGQAEVDSHYKLPIIKTSKNNLIKRDFKPFKKLNSQFAMTAHAVYKSYDPNFAATHSRFIIEKIIRKHIGFEGILISDDISMKALRYDIKKNTTNALDAGCNLVLHCNGNIKEMTKLVKIVPKIDKFTLKKTSQFYNFLR